MRWFSRILLLSVVFVLFGCSSANDEAGVIKRMASTITHSAVEDGTSNKNKRNVGDDKQKKADSANEAAINAIDHAAKCKLISTDAYRQAKYKIELFKGKLMQAKAIFDRAISANKYAQKGYEDAKRNLKDKDLAEAAHKLLKATETTSKNAEEARNRSTLVIDSVEISIRMADDANSKMISANDLAERASEDADKANEAAQTPTDDFSMEEYKLARKEYEDSKQQASDAKTGYEREKEAFIVVKKQHDASWIDYERTKKDMEHAKISFEHAREDSKRPTTSTIPSGPSAKPSSTSSPEESQPTQPRSENDLEKVSAGGIKKEYKQEQNLVDTGLNNNIKEVKVTEGYKVKKEKLESSSDPVEVKVEKKKSPASKKDMNNITMRRPKLEKEPIDEVKPKDGESWAAFLKRKNRSPGSLSQSEQLEINKSFTTERGGLFQINDFAIARPIGKGAFGRVYLAKDLLNDGLLVAIKVIPKVKLEKRRMEHLLLREIDINQTLRHPNVVRLLTYFWDDKRVYIVMEFCIGGDLYSRLEKKKIQGEKAKAKVIIICSNVFKQSFKIVKDVATALLYCHQRGIIHRDLKPENILVSANGVAKLGDFGFSVIASEGEPRNTLAGTPDYLAPEIVRGDPHTEAVDNWALGVLAYEMLAGQAPFSHKDQKESYKLISDGKYTPPAGASAPAIDFISRLLQLDPKDRMSLKDVLLHPWLTQE